MRTTPDAVAAVMRSDSPASDYDGVTDLTPYIQSASSVVDQVVVFAAQRYMPLPPATQELVERWLSAYFYCKADPQYASRSTGGASGSFVSDSGDPERYKKAAIDIDWSGCLSAILKRQFAHAFWPGRSCRTGTACCW